METRNERNITTYKSVHPGELVKAWLDDVGMTQKDFAASIGIPASRLNELIKGKHPMTEELAEKIASGLGMDAAYWMRLQINYDYNEKMLALRGSEEAEAKEWIDEANEKYDIHKLLTAFHITETLLSEKVARLKEILNSVFNGEDILNPSFCGCYRKSSKLELDKRNLNTWVVIVYARAVQEPCATPFAPERIDEAAKHIARLANTGTLTKASARETLESIGITYVEEPKLPKVPVNGYSVVINGRPVIAMTYRHNNADMLAFDILHELAHLKYDNGAASVSFGPEYSVSDTEKQADRYASDKLIPQEVWKGKILKGTVESIDPHILAKLVASRAKANGISPTIALWRYKHETKCYNIGGEVSPKLQ